MRLGDGMSAALTVTLQDNPAGIVRPPEAVRQTASGPVVLRRDPASGVEAAVPLTLGEAVPGGLETRSGVRAIRSSSRHPDRPRRHHTLRSSNDPCFKVAR